LFVPDRPRPQLWSLERMSHPLIVRRDLDFMLHDWLKMETLFQAPAFAEHSRESIDAVLDLSENLAVDLFLPHYKAADAAEPRLENGQVITLPAIKTALEQYAELGLFSAGFGEKLGGLGLPYLACSASFAFVGAANIATAAYPMLTTANARLIAEFGTPAQVEAFARPQIAGRWFGTMCLSEPQAGSNLADVRTRAVADGEDELGARYRLSGNKMWISGGDQDISENIVHLVLARLPDAPAGPKGISLFLTPKFAVNADGSLGERNAFRPVGVEHKLGIHASPTCVMSYEGARAELVGQPNQGLAHMFVMSVMKAKVAAARAICLSTGVAADLARHAATEDERKAWKGREDLFTPIAKAWSTDVGCEVASLGVQVHGGMGFIEETGAAQYYRDARITPIYEGTNGIQAMDLVGRKLSMDNGESAKALIAEMKTTLAQIDRLYTGKPVERFATAIEAVEDATLWLLDAKSDAARAADVLAGADAYLKLMGDVVGGWMLAKGALAAKAKLDANDGDAAWLQGKLDLYEVYAANVLGHVSSRLAAVGQGGDLLQRMTVDALAG